MLNIILDPVFHFRPCTWASRERPWREPSITQTVSAVWVLSFLCGKKSILRVARKENLNRKKAVLVPVLALGASPFIMQATECLVQLTYNSGMQHYGNDYYVGAMTILFSIMQMLFLPLSGLTQGAQPILRLSLMGPGTINGSKRPSGCCLRRESAFPWWGRELCFYSPRYSSVCFRTMPR